MRRALAVLSLVVASGCAKTHHIVALSVTPGAREAIVVLPGLGYAEEGDRDFRKFATRVAASTDFDVYVPDIEKRDGIPQSVAALERFAASHEFAHYEKLHFVAYILGGVTLNLWLQDHAPANLGSVVYDRSPLQERAPAILVKTHPYVTRMIVGNVIFDLAKIDRPVLERSDIPIGLIIESRATGLIKHFHKRALAMGPVSFNPDGFGQPHTAYCYVWLNHDEMYHRFDVLEPEILSFARTGRFTDAARKEPFTEDPFTK